MRSDVPPESGLGSSSALVVALLKLISAADGLPADPHALAELAYRIERVDAGIPGGRQDQVAAAFGGMSVYHFGGPRVIVEPVPIEPAALRELESCLVLGHVGDRRPSARHVMEHQVRRLEEGATLRYHDETKAFVDEGVRLLRYSKIAEHRDRPRAGVWTCWSAHMGCNAALHGTVSAHAPVIRLLHR